MGLKLTTDSFVEKANKIHMEKYDYSNVIYKKSSKKIKIVCKIHGQFDQTPNNHLSGHGCPVCSTEGKKKRYSYTTDIFIKKANAVHNNFYDYSKVMYTGTFNKIKILCPRHGEFIQSPSSHLHGGGCPKCSHVISKKETDFLDTIKIDTRNYYLPELKHKSVDGFNLKTNTVYEFLGDYWHGNPIKYSFNKLNSHRKEKFGYLFKETFRIFDKIKEKGYKVKYIWENDWENWKKIKGSILIKNY